MNHIQNIEIKNFKSVHHQKIEDCRRVNVFIGYPNVGKSNILEALSLASNFNNNSQTISFKDLFRFEELIGLYNDGNKQKKIELKVNGFNYVLEYFDQHNLQYCIIQEGSITDTIQPALSDCSQRFTINQKGNVSVISAHSERKQPTVKVKKYQFRAFSNHLKNNPTNLDFPFGHNIFEVIRYNAELRKECGELFNFFNLKLAFDEDIKLKVQKQLDEYSVFQIPMTQVSDTLQRLIFHKAAIATNQNSSLLFEEPEAHMFPPYISKLTSDIVNDENNNQFFLTTHSPFVLNDLISNVEKDELSVYIVSYENETGETLIHRMSEEDVDEAYQFGYDFFMNINNFIPQKKHE